MGTGHRAPSSGQRASGIGQPAEVRSGDPRLRNELRGTASTFYSTSVRQNATNKTCPTSRAAHHQDKRPACVSSPHRLLNVARVRGRCVKTIVSGHHRGPQPRSTRSGAHHVSGTRTETSPQDCVKSFPSAPPRAGSPSPLRAHLRLFNPSQSPMAHMKFPP